MSELSDDTEVYTCMHMYMNGQQCHVLSGYLQFTCAVCECTRVHAHRAVVLGSSVLHFMFVDMVVMFNCIELIGNRPLSMDI